MTDHDCAGPGLCGTCNQEAATAAYRGVMPAPTVNCPACGHTFTPTEEVAVRTTEADTSTADVQYADPGYQADKRKRYPLDTEKRVKAAWSYINKDENAAKYKKTQLNKVRGAIKAAMKKLGIKATEAVINGKPTFGEIADAVADAIKARLRDMSGSDYVWAWVCDMTDTDVVYQAGTNEDLYQCTYAIGSDGSVTLGDPIEVERTYAPAPEGEPEDDMDPVMEAERVQINGRILESKGTDDTGGRIFSVRVIAYGDSKNNRRYPESVLRSAAGLYEGAKAFDHHRSAEEMASGTIAGLVGYYRNATATAEGIEADLYLLPSATHAAEALDAALALGNDDPFVGISHDVFARFRSIQENGRQIQEATDITSVNSADIVSHPAAGGKATRVVAGGIENDPVGAVPPEQSTEEYDVPVKREDVLAAIREASDDELAAAGLARAGTKTTETAAPEKTTEAVGQAKDSFLGRLMVKEAISAAELPVTAVEAITAALPDRISESDVAAQIAAIKTSLGIVERAGLAPTATATVTKEAVDKKVTALDAFFAADYRNGYRSFKEAFCDFTGKRPKSFDEDFNKTILRESIGHFDSAERSTESMSSSTWNLVLGDSITRRMVAEYAQPSLQTWRNIISSSIPVSDFRTQRIDRIGGYGTLPGVNQGAPYQPLTSPANEEVTYAVTKRGGTEDVTLEMIANDDVRAIQRIPGKLGLAAAQTVYRFIWDMLDTNANIYDGNALFTVGGAHSNSATNALSQTNLSAARLAMRAQAAYGDTTNILSLIPKTLIVVNDLEELAFQLCTSAVAIPATPAGPTDTPNIHQGLAPIIVDYWTSTTKWITVADPTLCPTIEMGWYQGREDPELFTQSDPTVGSVFDADKVTYKIRHIYSGAVLDFRGFYRGNS
jgi:hypothetical protein